MDGGTPFALYQRMVKYLPRMMKHIPGMVKLIPHCIFDRPIV